MKHFIVMFSSILIASMISDLIYFLIDLNYNLFIDKFDFLLFTLDVGIYLSVFLPIYFLLRKLLLKE
ncbi:hypothetical protein CN373_07530 [Bacillus cereus]|uniref:Uncharacterized protein n=1 Tax=Bacillus cereus TaxID=1396 RepID=A0AA44QET1_BACCE|nr:hypothetical protein CN373_07530 [Bacillus cereus]PFN06966.1 hypothetical protein COJ55_12270 [Bacillus cereus]PFO80536.1 hypothetical protein COJ77_17340 [Bacillus cereus]PFR24293.1 hypothetical protein COK19_18515 [Bacillus cereus]PFS06806.1 hypothetical protein COK38_02545 [Bacillus cereus]